ncbi:MAG TPA: cell surface protein [Planctomycetaceae bacterium]|nr:cell surface protein [Planctomycetaceae bacterium]
MSLWAQEKTIREINVFPPAVQLDSARDFQTIIVQAIREDSVTEDVTGSAKMAFQNPECAVLERVAGQNATSLRLTPKQDGDTVLVVTYEGHQVKLPVSVRSAEEKPPLSFRLDVMPVFARAGCNMGSCHGAARGKDGFRLSLFGFDPTGDYHRLTREMPGRRINLANPEGSLVVQKAIGAVPHTGGKRFEKDSELADRLVQWIAAGAKDDPNAGKDAPKLQAVDLYPPTTLLEGKQATQQLVAVARFSDGTDRDVTDLVWYGSNNDSSVAITPSGNAASSQRGESFLMARYDTITVGVPVVVIPKDLTFEYPESEGNTWVDDLVDMKLKSLRIAPSNVCDDETFLRRVTIDLVGLLPTEEERNEFLADKSQDKRSEYVERLLGRKEFVDLWVMKWAEILQIRSINNIVDKKGALLYHQWLDRRIASNQPLNKMVRDLITASGGTFENPPTNYYQAERDTLKLTENVAQAFLGMRIQCAQCHNHPFDRWTMDDYYGFAAFFAQIGRKRADDPRETIIYNSGGGGMKHPVSGQTVAPKYLGGGKAEVTNGDRREAVAEWLVSSKNPFFAKRIANLVWTHFFGRGIVHEPDDFRVSNPPVNGPLLDALASHLVKSEWDFRELVREIVNSKTYQRECDTNDTNLLDNSNFSHSAVRRIRAEVLLDILAQVTETKNKFPGLPEGARAVQVADGRTSTYFLTTFGRATREDVCSCAVSMDPSLSQALHLLNGDVGNQRIQQGGVIDRWIKEGRPDTEIIDELFVRCYGRFPQERERVETLVAVQAGAGRKQALEDVFWALLNSPEFIFNH